MCYRHLFQSIEAVLTGEMQMQCARSRADLSWITHSLRRTLINITLRSPRARNKEFFHQHDQSPHPKDVSKHTGDASGRVTRMRWHDFHPQSLILHPHAWRELVRFDSVVTI